MTTSTPPGRPELRKALAVNWPLVSFVAVFSVFLNILMLTGPIFMLQVYDRVLASRSVETLAVMTLLVVFLFAVMGILDYSRDRVLSRIATRCNLHLSRRVFSANLRAMDLAGSGVAGCNGPRDLDSVRRLMASQVAAAMFDLPFTPFFLAFLFLLHPALGVLALGGGGLIILMSVLNHVLSRSISREADTARAVTGGLSNRLQSDSDTLRGLGMQDAAFDRWFAQHVDAQAKDQILGDRQSKFSTFTKTFRQLLQSLMLALGAWLVLRGELTAGAMIAASILMGRALQPVELIVGRWAMLQGAAQSWARLGDLLARNPVPATGMDLPRPSGRLGVKGAAAIPPGEKMPTLRGIDFDLQPGEVMGVIGASGSGKTSLARILTGSWAPAAGTVRLDGASIQQYREDRIGAYIGYLPQTVRLFDGTIGENIARLQPDASDDKIVQAARNACAHEMIVALPMGYHTPARMAGSQLSGGQMQRIGLARALYGNPALLVLDEPNASLDAEGTQALEQAIAKARADGCSVIIMTHRPGILRQCDKLLVLNKGRQVDFGPREEVLKKRLAPVGSADSGNGPAVRAAGLGRLGGTAGSARPSVAAAGAARAVALRSRGPAMGQAAANVSPVQDPAAMTSGGGAAAGAPQPRRRVAASA